MPEPDAHTETVRAGTPLRIGHVTLLPVERLVMYVDRVTTHAWFAVSKVPYALVVRDSDGIRAVAIGAAVSLEELRAKIPRLDDLLTLE